MATFLQIVPYPIYPPRNGGALRCVHLLRQLARKNQGRAVVYQDPADLEVLREELGEEIIVQSTNAGPWVSTRVAGGRLAGLRYRWLTRSIQGPAERFFLDAQRTLRDLRRESFTPDVVLFEGTGTLSLAPLLRKWNPNSIFILDAHNIDHVLMEQELQTASRRGITAGDNKKRLYAATKKRETDLAHYVNAIFACSEDDRIALQSMNKSVPGFVVPNGVDCSKIAFRAMGDRPPTQSVLFCGSLEYPANVDGLEWFGTEIWPSIRKSIPGCCFTIVGRGGDRDRFGDWVRSREVKWIGEVDDVLEHYHTATVAVCPLRVGSGTRLKVLEAMSSGTPVISTTLGAEGLIENCFEALMVADSPKEFAAEVCRVVSSKTLAERKSLLGRQIVLERFDWNVVGREMEKALDELLGNVRTKCS